MGAGGWDGVGVVLGGLRMDDSNAMLRGEQATGCQKGGWVLREMDLGT